MKHRNSKNQMSWADDALNILISLSFENIAVLSIHLASSRISVEVISKIKRLISYLV